MLGFSQQDAPAIAVSVIDAGPYAFQPAFTTTFTTSNASIGDIITPSSALTIYGIGACLTTVTGGTYKLGIAPYDTGTNKITGAPTYATAFTETSGAAGRHIYRRFATPFAMASGQSYIIFIVRTDSTSTVSQTMNFVNSTITSPSISAPPTSGVTARLLASTAPTTADTWSSGGNGVWAIRIDYTT